MERALRVGLVVAMLLLCGVGAAAQAPPSSTDRPAPELDIRLGALWPEENAQPRLAAGGRLALRPWPSVFGGRISLQVTGDFRSFGGQNGYDDQFQVQRRIARNRLVLGAAAGVDLLRRTQTTLDLRIGGALVRTRTNFLIDSSQGFVDDDNIWENVCPFEGFDARCSTRYEGTALVALGLRRDLVQSGAAFFGVDYTALGIGQHLLVGTIGLRLR